MAFHESHERVCLYCKARMSATAPKCLNCGRLVDEDEDDTPDRPPTRWGVLIGVAIGLVAAAVLAYFLRGRKDEPPPEDANRQELHRMMAQAMGRESLNESSRMTWAEFEPELRAGRPFKDVVQLIGERDPGAPKAGTLISSGGELPGARPESGGQTHGVFLKDVTVYVHTDAAGNIVSWDRRRPGS